MTGPALTREECQRLSGLVRLGLKAGLFGVQYEDFLQIADLVEAYPIVVEPSSAIRPTREELGPLVENARWWLSRSLGASPFSVEEGDRLTERTITLLDAYPLPPEDGPRASSGERDEIAQAVEICLNLVDDLEGGKVVEAWTADADAMALVLRNARRAPALLGALPPEDGERAELANRALRHATAIQVAHGPTARVLRECAAALLRQPPRGGVSKEAVKAAIRKALFHQASGPVATLLDTARENCLKAVETLPEAAPRESPEDERERQRLADVVESVGKRGLSPWQEEDMKKASELLRRRRGGIS